MSLLAVSHIIINCPIDTDHREDLISNCQIYNESRSLYSLSSLSRELLWEVLLNPGHKTLFVWSNMLQTILYRITNHYLFVIILIYLILILTSLYHFAGSFLRPNPHHAPLNVSLSLNRDFSSTKPPSPPSYPFFLLSSPSPAPPTTPWFMPSLIPDTEP